MTEGLVEMPFPDISDRGSSETFDIEMVWRYQRVRDSWLTFKALWSTILANPPERPTAATARLESTFEAGAGLAFLYRNVPQRSSAYHIPLYYDTRNPDGYLVGSDDLVPKRHALVLQAVHTHLGAISEGAYPLSATGEYAGRTLIARFHSFTHLNQVLELNADPLPPVEPIRPRPSASPYL